MTLKSIAYILRPGTGIEVPWRGSGLPNGSLGKWQLLIHTSKVYILTGLRAINHMHTRMNCYLLIHPTPGRDLKYPGVAGGFHMKFRADNNSLYTHLKIYILTGLVAKEWR